MLMNETSKRTGLTKKAIEYYAEQGLVVPSILANGYRDFSERDIERLNRISVFRRLGLSTQEIGMVLADETGNRIKKISVQKEIDMRKDQSKKAILDKIAHGKSDFDITEELNAIEETATVAERLLEAFPGYYGRFVCLHFARFLDEPIATAEQKNAYREIVTFLDHVSPFQFPEEVQMFLDESAILISTETICDMIERTKQSIENPEKFFSENRKMIEEYFAFKQSDAYKKSPMNKVQALLKEFNATSGYYDLFIPAMKRLSKSYSEYCKQLEIANEKLLLQYPELAVIRNPNS